MAKAQRKGKAWHMPATGYGDWGKTWCGRTMKGLNVVGEGDYQAAIDASVLADGRRVCERCRMAYDN